MILTGSVVIAILKNGLPFTDLLVNQLHMFGFMVGVYAWASPEIKERLGEWIYRLIWLVVCMCFSLLPLVLLRASLPVGVPAPGNFTTFVGWLFCMVSFSVAMSLSNRFLLWMREG